MNNTNIEANYSIANLPKSVLKKYHNMIADYYYSDGAHDVILKENFDNGNDGRCIRATTVKELNADLKLCTEIEIEEAVEMDSADAYTSQTKDNRPVADYTHACIDKMECGVCNPTEEVESEERFKNGYQMVIYTHKIEAPIRLEKTYGIYGAIDTMYNYLKENEVEFYKPYGTLDINLGYNQKKVLYIDLEKGGKVVKTFGRGTIVTTAQLDYIAKR